MNILDRIHDDFEEYQEICQSLGVTPKWVDKGFYRHLDEVLTQHGFKSIEHFYQKQNEQNKKITGSPISGISTTAICNSCGSAS